MDLRELLLPENIFMAFSTAHSPSLFRSATYICRYHSWLSYITQPSAKRLTIDYKFLQISFTYARNSSGPNTLTCGTPDVTLTASGIYLPAVTSCEQRQRISLTHMTSLESTPEVAILTLETARATTGSNFTHCKFTQTTCSSDVNKIFTGFTKRVMSTPK